jgi:signal transduction histidine kinase
LSETDRMQNLAFKLLDLALISNNTLELHPVIPSQLFESVRAATEQKLQDKQLQLEIS